MFDRRLMELCPESKKYIVGNIILQWLEMMMNTIMVFHIASFIEKVYYHTNTNNDLYTTVIVVVLTGLFRFFLVKKALRMSHLASRTIMGKMRKLIYEKLLCFGSRYTEKISTAELVQESVEGVEQLESYFGQYVPQFFYAFIAPITLFVIFIKLGSLSAAVVLLVCVPLIPGAIMMVQKIAKKLLAKYWGQYTRLGSTFLENLQGMTTLKTYQADEYKNIEMNKESENFRVVTMKVLTMQLNSIIIMDFFTYGGGALGIIMALRSFNNHDVTIAGCIMMIMLSVEFFLPMRRLGSYFHVAMNGMAASDKIFNFLTIPTDTNKNKELTGDFKTIDIENLSFSYDGNNNVLNDISMEIRPHEFIGIVGESGSGKSTIASLLMGRIKSSTGSIRINDSSIDEISERSLMNYITYIGHDSRFFKGTVKNNLLMANPELTDKQMWDVLKQCDLEQFLKTEDGLDTMLMENAMNFSGGQRQRLALARAILHESPVYIFDEATSNIDIESEEIINIKIKEMRKDKTVIMITHRLFNVKDADRIYVLDKGGLSEVGNHDQLINSNGIYKNLYETQRRLETFNQEDAYEKK